MWRSRDPGLQEHKIVRLPEAVTLDLKTVISFKRRLGVEGKPQEAVRSRRDEDLEGGASLTIRRSASRLTMESEESVEHFVPRRSRQVPGAMPFSDNGSS